MIRLSPMTKPFLVLLAGCMLLIAPNYAWSENEGGTTFTQEVPGDALSIRGRVKKISFEDHTIVVKPRKGKSVTVTFTEKTPLVGFTSLEEIEKKQPVKITYEVQGETNRAVEIKKIPATGC